MSAPVRSLLVPVGLLAIACAMTKGTARGASAEERTRGVDPPVRTPVIHYVMDDRPQLQAVPGVGVVVQGDRLIVTVDSTRRFGGQGIPPFPVMLPARPNPDGGIATVEVSPALRHLYVRASGPGVEMRRGRCSGAGAAGAALPVDSEALRCEAATDVGPASAWQSWDTHPLMVCPADRDAELLGPGGRDQAWALVVGNRCANEWLVSASDHQTVAGVTLVLMVDGMKREVGAVEEDGRWNAQAELPAGAVRAEVRLKYRDGTAGVVELPPAEGIPVAIKSEHSLVRIQPEILVADQGRAINAAIVITPVSRDFFDLGPWKRWPWLNGFSPSVVIRFSGSRSILQFGLAGSFFLNESMQLNAGILFGTVDAARPWNPVTNLFLGFAIDPLLFLEASRAGGSGGPDAIKDVHSQ